jgi:two-component system osmolarity sensor histidine kinase EnvZ
MTSQATSLPHERSEKPGLYWRFSRFLERYLPAGLYQRSLIIVVAPIVALQTIMAGIILDRHWDQVTKVLSRSLAREIATVIELYRQSPRSAADLARIEKLANEKLNMRLSILRNEVLPPPLPAPLFSAVDRRLNRYLANDVGLPFWIDTSGQGGFVDIRVEAEKQLIFRIQASEERTYAASTHVFLIWMLQSSLVILAIAVVFLRKQIEPILQLAQAAKSFGMGHDVAKFQPRGAAEVREAAMAFLAMKERIERHVEQRTAMLAGVSHDLRTILTRFRLEIAMLKDSSHVEALKEDVEEMQRMLEGYMAFVRGDGGERAEPVDISEVIAAAARHASRSKSQVTVEAASGTMVKVKPNAFQRLLTNLIANALQYGKRVKIGTSLSAHQLQVIVDDDGPGIAAELREEVFRPFVRLDHARNQDETGTGLGLAIARDIARAHGGDIQLSDSPLGGLRAIVHIPV